MTTGWYKFVSISKHFRKRGRPFLMKSASKRFGNASDTETDGETVNKTVTRKRGRPRVKARSPSTSSDDDMTEANERSSQRKQGRPRSGSQPRPPAANSNQPNPENSSEKRNPDILRSKNRPRPMNWYPESSRKGQDQPERKLTCTRIRSPFSQRTGSNGNSPVKTQDRLDQVYSDKIGTKPSVHRKPCVRRIFSGSENVSRNDGDYYYDIAGRERAERMRARLHEPSRYRSSMAVSEHGNREFRERMMGSRGKPFIGDVYEVDKGISFWSARLKPDVMIEEFKQEVDEEDDIVEAHPGYRPVTSLSPDWMGRAREVWRARDAEKKHTTSSATSKSVLPDSNLSFAPVDFDPMYGILPFGKPAIPCQHDFQLPRTVFGDLNDGSLAYGQSSHISSGEDRHMAKPSIKPRPFEMQPHLDEDWMRIKPRLPEADRGQIKPRPFAEHEVPFVERAVENRPRPLEQETSQARPTPMDNEDANLEVDVSAAVNREGVVSVAGESSVNTDLAEKEQQSGPVPPENEPAKRRGRGRPRKDEKKDVSMAKDDTASEGIERDSQTDVKPAIPDIIGSGLRRSERSTRYQGNARRPADGSKNMKEKEPLQQSSSCSSSQQTSLETSSADEGPSDKRRGQTGRGRGRPARTGERRSDRLFHQQLGSPSRVRLNRDVRLPLAPQRDVPPITTAEAGEDYQAMLQMVDDRRRSEFHYQMRQLAHRIMEADPSFVRHSTPRPT